MAKASAPQQPQPEARPRAAVRVGDVEALIKQLPGVVAARLVVNDWGGVEEVHVLATAERSAKHIVRDIESSLQARWGLRIDHRKISVAQLADAGLHLPPMRPRLLGVTVTTDLTRARTRATVSLGLPNDEEARIEGHAEGPSLASHQLRIVAQATVDALNRALRTDHRLSLEEVRVIRLGAFDVAVAVLTLEGAKVDQRVLTGAVVVETDPVDAVVKACLHASNRFVERHIVHRVARPSDGARPDPQRLEGEDLPGTAGPGAGELHPAAG